MVRTLREERAWSQEHLAAAAGLGLRTVQRVEADGNASLDTRMALASAFGVEVGALGVPPRTEIVPPVVEPVPEVRKPAWGAARLLAIAALLFLVDLGTHGRVTWSRWTFLGLGAGATVLLARRRIPGLWIWAIAALGLVGLDLVRSGRPTWSLWVVFAWFASVGLPWMRRMERGRPD